jgi:hypothetical protein
MSLLTPKAVPMLRDWGFPPSLMALEHLVLLGHLDGGSRNITAVTVHSRIFRLKSGYIHAAVAASLGMPGGMSQMRLLIQKPCGAFQAPGCRLVTVFLSA